uniref:Secreted protein n=1 Tax=Parascaris univalens TaxID=6257 RepID=A0A915ATG7_PARUN
MHFIIRVTQPFPKSSLFLLYFSLFCLLFSYCCRFGRPTWLVSLILLARCFLTQLFFILMNQRPCHSHFCRHYERKRKTAGWLSSQHQCDVFHFSL